MMKDTTNNQSIQNKISHPSAMGATLPLGRVLLSARRGVLFLTALLMAANLFFAPLASAQDKSRGGVSEQTQDGIDWDRLVNAIIAVESGGNPNAYNKSSGCIGLMQINPMGALKEWNNKHRPFHSESGAYPGEIYHVGNLYNPEINVKIGTWYLHRIAEHYLKNVVAKHPAEFYYTLEAHLKNGKVCEAVEIDSRIAKKYFIENGCDHEISLICAAYNGGITRLKKCNYDINCMPKETRNYVRKVLGIYKKGEVR